MTVAKRMPPDTGLSSLTVLAPPLSKIVPTDQEKQPVGEKGNRQGIKIVSRP